MPKPRYKTTNWKQYNKALINRGSLTFWIDEEAIRQWKQSKQDKRGRPRQFSDLAITTTLMVKRVFSMPLRALQGFIDSVFSLANVPIVCPHYSCISRRAKQVEVSFKPKTRGAIQHLAIDATGLKVYGEGEWKVKKHGTDGKHRVWRKLHLAVGCQKLYGSNNKWKKRYGYHKRSLSETAMYRVKQLLGGRLSLRNYNAQVGETYAMIKALNKLTGLGMPETQYIV
ncbi:IS5 family transposase [Vibrio alginolyticus]|uniref:IS5 family transposase n=1 Tax=Vibrio alginolyticus TaxID=663 RepID=UPI00355244D2